MHSSVNTKVYSTLLFATYHASTLFTVKVTSDEKVAHAARDIPVADNSHVVALLVNCHEVSLTKVNPYVSYRSDIFNTQAVGALFVYVSVKVTEVPPATGANAPDDFHDDGVLLTGVIGITVASESLFVISSSHTKLYTHGLVSNQTLDSFV